MRVRARVRLLPMALLVLISTGCAAPSSLMAPGEKESADEPIATPVPTIIYAPSAAKEDARIEAVPSPETGGRAMQLPFDSPAALAVHDLSQRLGVDAEGVVVMEIADRELPAEGLGCPGGPAVKLPGQGDNAVVAGQQIVLAVAGREYTYHAYGWQIVLCRPAEEFSDLSLPPQPGPVEAPVDAAKAALSRDLGMDRAGIELLEVEAVEWPDSSLGCPEPGMMYAQVLTPGYRITLKTESTTYEYHSDQQRVVLCQSE